MEDCQEMILFVSSFVITSAVLWWLIRFSKKREIFIDDAEEKKPQNFHEISTPRIGGLGILAGISLMTTLPFGLQMAPSILLSFLSGFFEDLHNSLSPSLRLLLQVVAASFGVLYAHAVVTYLGLGITMPYWLGLLFSIFAIVGMMNAINIIDGFNGLAGGIVLLALLSFGYVASNHHDTTLTQIIMITLGALLGFMWLNFPKGRIFLGDGGAYMLGALIGTIGIYLAGAHADVSPWYVLSVFVYPVWEVLFSIIRKLSKGHSPMQPDSYHLHMLIYRHITRNNPLTALVIVLMVLPFVLVATRYAHSSLLNLGNILLFILGYLWLYRYLVTKEP